jgi:hypothetical protein
MKLNGATDWPALRAPAFRHGDDSRVIVQGHDSPKQCRFVVCQAEEMGMAEQRVRKTYKDQFMPIPQQERTLATVVWRCRELSNAGLQERKTAWEKAASV